MTALGIGVRVYIGFVRNVDCCSPLARAARCSTGTIVSGPYAPGTRVFSVDGVLYENNLVSWEVQTDDLPRSTYAAEKILTPIDDWDEKAEPREAVKEAT